jgi:hypothetical protein
MQPNMLQLVIGTVVSVNADNTIKITFQAVSTAVTASPSSAASGVTASIDCPALVTSAHASVDSTGTYVPGYYAPGDFVQVLINNSGSALCILGVIL